MFFWAITIIGILNSSSFNFIQYGEFWGQLIAGIVELYLEIKLFTKWLPSISKNLKDKKEISDLENQIKKEKLQKELAELKQQNSH